MNHRFWLLFDVGVRAELDPLYTWLDAHAADEVPGGATFVFSGTVDDLVEALREQVQPHAGLRGYCVGRKSSDDGIVGRWVWGKRQYAPWTGYAGNSEDEWDDEDPQAGSH